MNHNYDVLIAGGGAAGFFTAVNLAEAAPHLKIAIFERGKQVLSKVKVSGGGRCNVTHAEFDPRSLATHYPRGEKELLGPFHSFMTGDTMAWFEERGVPLKIEEDGRIFPESDSSQTIINCFTTAASRLGVEVLLGCGLREIAHADGRWHVLTTSGEFACHSLVIATGSSTKVWDLLTSKGHSIVPPVPSLFTFNVDDERITDLPGVSRDVAVQVLGTDRKVILDSEGPLLITHWGFSGPAILKLSAWGARLLEPTGYQFEIRINWLGHITPEEALSALLATKGVHPRQALHTYSQWELPKRLWQQMVRYSGIDATVTWADVSKSQLQELAQQLTKSRFSVHGKSTFKEEFVTAGGIALEEVNFKTFESKLFENLYFAGEVLNVDAITGGFNFQNAWTGGFLAARSIAAKI
ncbi:MAG: NAD(P)/FAD-dependent oxidoreductase [Bacteroidota bacterium]